MSAGYTAAQVTAAFTAAGNGMTAPSNVTNPDGSVTYTATSTSGALTIKATLFTEFEVPAAGKSGVYQVLFNAALVAADITSVKAFLGSLGQSLGPNVQLSGMGVPGANGTVVAFSQSF